MIRKLLIGFLLLSPLIAKAQLLSVTATLTDSDSTVWQNATCSVQVYSPNSTAYYNGTAIPTGPQTCAVDGSGVLTTSIYNTSTATPVGVQYSFNICSQTSAACSAFNTPIVAANSTSALSALLVAPRFNDSPTAYGYADVEAIPSSVFGTTYYNTTTPAWRQWNGTARVTVGSGGGGAPAYPLTITGGVSGGVVYGNSATSLTVSPAGTTNVLMKWGGAGAAPANSSITDNGTSVISTEYFGASGTLTTPAVAANTTYMDNSGAGIARILSVGPNSSTQGIIQLYGIASDNSSATLFVTMIPGGSAVFGIPVTSTGAATTAGTGAISYGGTTAAASNCNSGGIVTGVTGCVIINVAGTTRYTPYY
jgi:hypothetical protein